MIYNEDTYYVGYHRNVRELGAVSALVFDTISGLVANSDGIISNDSIAELLGITERCLRGIIATLIEKGYIEKVAGNGRGKKTTYILTEKGEQNAPLYAQKGGTKRPKKGEQNAPLSNIFNNKDYNKDLICTKADASGKEKKEKINFIMEDFEKFWKAFNVSADHESEKERCERVWLYMNEEKKSAIIQELEKGSKSVQTDSPYVYLYNYQTPLPFYRQGTAKFGKWYDEQVKNNTPMCILRYDNHIVYCLLTDLPKMMDAGAEFIRNDAPISD